MITLGIDVGGTFTDFIAYDHDQKSYRVYKILSTPSNPMEAMITGIKEMGITVSEIEIFAHGTTVTTNAIIQKTGAKTSILTTKGFRDILQLRRTNRTDVYNLQWTPPDELVPRKFRCEIDERINSEGIILKPVNPEEVKTVVRNLINEGIESLAVIFLHSYVNPLNERFVKDIIKKEFPHLGVCISSDILPEWREFERTSTTVVNSYLTPILSNYISKLEKQLVKDGYKNDIFVMLSNGGLSTAQVAKEIPAHTLASGPAAGVMAEKEISKLSNEYNVVGIDIGGTSADVSLVCDGVVTFTAEKQIEFGIPIRLPAIEVISIGAGGGSIAWIDGGGGLHVGPQSAGAFPGPACYGRGGIKPTVTDANTVLGRLNQHYLLSGTMEIYFEKAKVSIDEYIAKPLNLSLEVASWGILEIVNQNMINAIRQVTIQRGSDPREFALFGYGGAGPLHSAQIAQELGMPKVIIPPHPGVTSALGLLMSDIRHDFCKTFFRRLDQMTPEILEQQFVDLEAKGKERLLREGIKDQNTKIVKSVGLRYLRQTHELTIEIPSDEGNIIGSISDVFRKRHFKEYGFVREPGTPIQIVNLRLTAIGVLPKPDIKDTIVCNVVEWFEKSTRPVLFEKDGGYVKTPVFDRNLIPVNKPFIGPAIIEQFDSTIVILPGQKVYSESNGNIIIETVKK